MTTCCQFCHSTRDWTKRSWSLMATVWFVKGLHLHSGCWGWLAWACSGMAPESSQSQWRSAGRHRSAEKWKGGGHGPISVVASQMAESLPRGSSQTRPQKILPFSSSWIHFDCLVVNQWSVFLSRPRLAYVFIHDCQLRRSARYVLSRCQSSAVAGSLNSSCGGGRLIVAVSCGREQIRIWIVLRGEAQQFQSLPRGHPQP